MCTTQGPSGIVANLAANEAPDPPRGVRAEPETWGDRPRGAFESVVANPVKNGDDAVEGPRLKKIRTSSILFTKKLSEYTNS